MNKKNNFWEQIEGESQNVENLTTPTIQAYVFLISLDSKLN